MSEKIEAYLCSRYGELFTIEEDAQCCEIRIKGIMSCIPNYRQHKQYPSSVTVKYDNKTYETYTIIRID